MSKRENRKKKERLKKLEESYAFFEDRRKHVAFSFQFLTVGENAGQSFEDWNKEGIILDLNNKLREFSKKTKKELLSDKSLAIYGEYPTNPKFAYPLSIPRNDSVQWARLSLTGARRIAGFFSSGADRESDIFNIVFLDKEHDFYPVGKKHT